MAVRRDSQSPCQPSASYATSCMRGSSARARRAGSPLRRRPSGFRYTLYSIGGRLGSLPRPPPRPPRPPPPPQVRLRPARRAPAAPAAAAPSVIPPAVGGGGGPCLRIVRGTVGRNAHPIRLTCSVPRCGETKNTPHPSRSSCARGTSPFAKVRMNLSVQPGDRKRVGHLLRICVGDREERARGRGLQRDLGIGVHEPVRNIDVMRAPVGDQTAAVPYQARNPRRLGLNGRFGAGPCHMSQSSPGGTGCSASVGLA